MKTSQGLALWIASIWVGGLWVCGYMVAPIVFQTLPDRQLAGMLAGRIFTVMAYTGILCALYLLAYHFRIFGKQALQHKAVCVISMMLLLTLVGHLGIQPIMSELKALALPAEVMHSTFADRFRIWHGVASIIYLVQSLLGVVLIFKLGGSANFSQMKTPG